MTTHSTNKEVIESWGKDGYLETWDGYAKNYSQEIFGFVKKQLGENKDKEVLEIGSGAGFWTEFLRCNSKKVTCLDIFEKPAQINNEIEWIVQNDRQFNCKQIESASKDFVFCFGVFCHFSVEDWAQYVKDVKRVLKDNGSAILMFGDTDKNPAAGFPLNNFKTTIGKIEEIGFKYESLLEYRDTLLLLKK